MVCFQCFLLPFPINVQDILGDCSRMRIANDSLRLSVVHHGYDALCVGNVIVQGVDGEFGRARAFRCDIPPQETIEYDTSDIYDCRPFDPGTKPTILALGTTLVYWSGLLSGSRVS